MTLRYIADIISQSRYLSVLKYHPRAKQLQTRNKQFNIFFTSKTTLLLLTKYLPQK